MVNPLTSALRSGSRFAAMSLGAIALSSVAVGWCYLLREHTRSWPGPTLKWALPLDALPHNDGVQAIVFVLIVAVASLLGGLLAKALKFDGFAIALSVGVGVGAWLYLATAVSIFIVTQDSLDEAFDVTRDVVPIYLAGALFALGVALVARRGTGERWLTRALPGAVAIFGLADLLSATLPPSIAERQILSGLLSAPSSPVSRTLEVGVGVILLLAARGLGRRGRRALVVAASMVVFSLGIRIVDGELSGSRFVAVVIFGALVLVGLVTRRSDFSYAGDPTTRMTGLWRALALIVVAFVYGFVALYINWTSVGLTFHWMAALRVTLHDLVGAPRHTTLISGGFSEWFPWSLRSIVGFGLAWGALTWFAPWRHRPSQEDARRDHAKALVDEFGEDTLAPFTLRHDKAYYLYPEGEAATDDAKSLIAYRVVRGVAIVSGDPVGPSEQAGEAIAAFRAMCAERGWKFALLGASERYLDLYREQGLRPLYHGDEAVVDIPSFSLAGGTLKSVRQAVGRLARKGYAVDIKAVGELAPTEREELSALEQRWLAGGERKGFVMELDELFRLDGNDAIFVIGRHGDGSLVGFLEVALCPASSSLSLSSMPRAETAPNGLNAFLIVAAIDWAREREYEAFSLNFSPAARLLDAKATCTGRRRVARRLLLIAKRFLGLQLDNLLMFNRHFGPRWAPRYLVVDRYRHLPRVLISGMAAERYLPFADLLLGRDWRMPADAPDGQEVSAAT